MKKSFYILIVFTCLIVAGVVFKYNAVPKTIDPYEVINSNLIETQSFSIVADSTNLKTSATGTFFLEQIKDAKYKVKISANIEIDQEDWGGVSFTVPNGWEIANIQSSYASNNENVAALKEEVSVWVSEGNEKWRYMIDVGRDSINRTSSGGGEGSVLIELYSTKEFTAEISLNNFIVAVGSDNEHGIGAVGTDYVHISFSIDEN